MHNSEKNPSYWFTCLPYEVRKEKHYPFTLYVDYVIIMKCGTYDFQENGIDLLPDRQLCLENIYFEGLEIASDFLLSSDESE